MAWIHFYHPPRTDIVRVNIKMFEYGKNRGEDAEANGLRGSRPRLAVLIAGENPSKVVQLGPEIPTPVTWRNNSLQWQVSCFRALMMFGAGGMGGYAHGATIKSRPKWGIACVLCTATALAN